MLVAMSFHSFAPSKAQGPEPHLSAALLSICVEDGEATILKVEYIIVFKDHHTAHRPQ